MKTILLIITSLHLTSVPLMSQNWFDGSPAWYYEYYNGCLEETTGHNKIFYEKDTLLNGVEVSKFNVERYRNSIFEPAYTAYSTFYLIQDGDKVYDYNYQSGDSTLLYDLSLDLGDTISYPLFSFEPEFCDTSQAIFVIDSTGFIEFENENLKFQQYRLITNTDYFGDRNFKVIEKIGAIGPNYLILRYNYHCFLDVCNPFTFKCYRNQDSETFFPDSEYCDNLLFAEELHHNISQNIKVYPNPVTDFLSIEFTITTPADIQIFNAQGQLIASEEIFVDNVQIPIAHFSVGVYFLKINTTQGVYQRTFIKL